MIETSQGGSCSFGALIPGHSHGIQSVQVLEDFVFISLASKNDNSLASQNCGVSEPRWRGSPLNSGLDPATRIQIEDVCVIQVSVAIDFASVEMTLQI